MPLPGTARTILVATLAMALVALVPTAVRADSGSVTRARPAGDTQIPRGTTVELLRRTLTWLPASGRAGP